MATPAGPDTQGGAADTGGSTALLDAPPENTDSSAPAPNPLDSTDFSLPLDAGDPAAIQANLEQPTGVHSVDDGSGGYATLETNPVTLPGVPTAWTPPPADSTAVLQSTTGAQTVGERP